MSFTKLASGLHNLAAKFAGASEDKVAIFLKKDVNDLVEKGRITEGFFLVQEKIKDGAIIFWLRIPNTPENLALLDPNQDACTNVVLKNYNPLYDNFIFDLDKNFTVPGDLSFISRQIKITKNKYAA